ncbi:LOW QUALITY PROTEIN: hypothetical protein PHMEG_0003384 [Phytophthora megakarya]|uniref:Uncharacterized protein n=1 Tax=Phytophthora megakarya TaxID=4795 RepID=A0A225WY41_9STRA|nr:LOW QUALITY PROTEIN: hypothetical protein PHMEG_0003384 [Phytophthora megakarya]
MCSSLSTSYQYTDKSHRPSGDYSPSRCRNGVETVHVEELAPVVVFLLLNSQLSLRITTHTGLPRAHARILDHLLGTRGALATRQIKSLLAGIAPVATHPDPSDQIVWMDPMSKHDVLCSVRLVENFGFYKDGGRPSPKNTVGNHYWRRPLCNLGRYTSDHSATTHVPSVYDQLAEANAPEQSGPPIAAPSKQVSATSENTSAVSIPSPHARFREQASEQEEGFEEVPNPVPRPRVAIRKRTKRELDDQATSARILSALADQPDLFQLYARQLGSLRQDRQRLCYSAVYDLLLAEGSGDCVGSHYSFRPSAGQQEVPDLICADEHRGNSPAAYVEHARASQGTKFMLHPAFLRQLYDFLFGVCGLSVLHFRQFDLSTRPQYTSSNHSNARNFFVKVEFLHLPKNPSHGDLKAALGVLGTFCDEFFDSHTCRLVSAAKVFADEPSDYEPCGPAPTCRSKYSRLMAEYDDYKRLCDLRLARVKLQDADTVQMFDPSAFLEATKIAEGNDDEPVEGIVGRDDAPAPTEDAEAAQCTDRAKRYRDERRKSKEAGGTSSSKTVGDEVKASIVLFMKTSDAYFLLKMTAMTREQYYGLDYWET